ncbi:MAG: AEC family transporter [Clostridiales Family XIII bacterium]|jgi:predicted permease|nr:AEC family transporter [Clostridiales Family XIII bacterium]
MINGIISVAVIFLVFALGFFFTVRKIWPENANSVLSVIVVQIAAPCLAVTGLSGNLTPDLLHSSMILILVCLIHVAMLYAAGKGLSRLLRLKGGRRTIFEASFTFSNTIFIGLPVNQIVFGDAGLPFLLAYYIVTLATYWSVGNFEIARASGAGGAGFSLKKILTPGLIGVIAGALIVEFEIGIPLVIDTAMNYMADLCVPLSLLVIGANLSAVTREFARPRLDELVVIAGKFIISPLFMYLLMCLSGNAPGSLPFRVLMLASAMPCHIQTSISAQYYGVEGDYAARLVCLSTLLCLVTIPLAVALFCGPSGG